MSVVPQMGNAEGIKPFLWGPYMSRNSCVPLIPTISRINLRHWLSFDIPFHGYNGQLSFDELLETFPSSWLLQNFRTFQSKIQCNSALWFVIQGHFNVRPCRKQAFLESGAEKLSVLTAFPYRGNSSAWQLTCSYSF